MTIHEFTRYIPLGSKVKLHFKDATQASECGVVCKCQYLTTSTASQSAQHTLWLQTDSSEERAFLLHTISYIDILALPEDYGTGENGLNITEASTHLFSKFNALMDPNAIQGQRLTLQNDFHEPVCRIMDVMNKRGFNDAAAQINALEQNGQIASMAKDKWFDLFDGLESALKEAYQNNDPDICFLRRGLALLCCYASKQHPVAHDALRIAAQLLVENLVQEKTAILQPDAYAEHRNEPDQALDWFLLAHFYRVCDVQNSCTYTALVQSILRLGRFFQNKVNRKIFCFLCGSAHDFTLLSQFLRRSNGEIRELYPKDQLLDFGHLMCWMLYQLGGIGILDSAELISSTTSNELTTKQQADLHERLLAYTLKYMPRNRNDRFTTISGTMDQLLTLMFENDPRTWPEYDGRAFGYIYEFNGNRGARQKDYSGHLLGCDLIPHRFYYHSDYDDMDNAYRLLETYHTAAEEGKHTLVPTRFYTDYTGPKKSRPAAYDLKLLAGGNVYL